MVGLSPFLPPSKGQGKLKMISIIQCGMNGGYMHSVYNCQKLQEKLFSRRNMLSEKLSSQALHSHQQFTLRQTRSV